MQTKASGVVLEKRAVAEKASISVSALKDDSSRTYAIVLHALEAASPAG